MIRSRLPILVLLTLLAGISLPAQGALSGMASKAGGGSLIPAAWGMNSWFGGRNGTTEAPAAGAVYVRRDSTVRRLAAPVSHVRTPQEIEAASAAYHARYDAGFKQLQADDAAGAEMLKADLKEYARSGYWKGRIIKDQKAPQIENVSVTQTITNKGAIYNRPVDTTKPTSVYTKFR